jgi:hypothetical protein
MRFQEEFKMKRLGRLGLPEAESLDSGIDT